MHHKVGDAAGGRVVHGMWAERSEEEDNDLDKVIAKIGKKEQWEKHWETGGKTLDLRILGN